METSETAGTEKIGTGGIARNRTAGTEKTGTDAIGKSRTDAIVTGARQQ